MAMRTVLLAMVAGLTVAAGPTTGPAVERRVEAVMAKLSAADRVRLLAGVDDFYTRAVPGAGLRRFKFTDGPVGTRNDGPSTAYPAAVSLAATWSPELAERMGAALGRDARARGADVVLGPAVNICRVPQGGRNFEYMGEDPLLAGRQAAAYVRGVQGQGVAACVKHFAANNQDDDRFNIDEAIGERALQEIYFPAFEAAIKGGNCRAVMCSYNKVNGTYASANRYLLTDVLRKQWGFDGLCMSDWGAVHDAAGPLAAGLDLEMPGPAYFKPAVVEKLIADGTVTAAMVDEKVRRLVRVGVQMGWLDRPSQRDDAIPLDDPANDAVALDVARAGIVLLKNAGGALPLDKATVKRVAVLGPGADQYVSGGGSSHTDPTRPVTLLAGLRAVAPGVQFDPIPFHGVSGANVGRMARASQVQGDGWRGEYFGNKTLAGKPAAERTDRAIDFDWRGGPADGVGHDDFSVRWTGRVRSADGRPVLFAVRSDDGSRVKVDGRVVIDDWSDHQARTASAVVPMAAGRSYEVVVEYYQGGGDATVQFGYTAVPAAMTADERQRVASADVAVVLVNTTESEGGDRPYDLPADQVELVTAATAANRRTTVVLESGGNVGMADWVDGTAALVEAWFPGQAGGRAGAEVLFGDVNPSGHLPDTFGKTWADEPAHGHYPGSAGHVDYAEGIYVGYRGYDHRGIAPRFPFGHGLSYTTFDVGRPRVVAGGDADGRTFAVTVDVTNTGHRAGACVAQMYVRPPAGGTVDRPPQELKGFGRVDLSPGETKSVTMTLDRRSFAHWDVAAHQWQVVPGRYEVAVGRSSRDICCTAAVEWR